MDKEKLYKVISNDYKSINGGNFDWKPYLPKGKKAGKWTPRIKNVSICLTGYHLTRYWNFWLKEPTNLVFEVKAKGIKAWESDKCVCETVQLIKQVTLKFDKKNNTGSFNTGKCNTGDCNTGRCNTGNCNTGDCNTGKCNTGNRNTGSFNTGHNNTGNCNTGESNTGRCNTGDYNTGYRNSGNWNICDYENGHFNTEQSKNIQIFNKTCKRIDWENAAKPNFIYFKLDDKLGYKKTFIKAFKKTTLDEIKMLINLPNFDYTIFEEISGITKQMIKNRLKSRK